VTWWAIGITALGTYAMKAAGPVLVGARVMPERLQRLFALISLALLGALIAVTTATVGTSLTLDARAAGLGAAGVAILLRAPFVVVVVVAAVVAAGLRLL
jgi:Branched-chain amino acid transport protein (AzlD)